MSTMNAHPLDAKVVGRVLDRLEIPLAGKPDFQTLRDFYAAWCQRVPFDNVQKIIHVHSEDTGPLPGSTAMDFFHDWLAYGTGGTCWSGAEAMLALLNAMGFRVERTLGTMLVAPHLPPNHGSVLVHVESERFLLDTSMLHHAPLLILESQETCIDHPAWGVSALKREGRWHIKWRPLHKPEGFDCRIEQFGTPAVEFENLYDQTRGWSPFNYQVSARRNYYDEVIGLGFGSSINFRADGSVISAKIDDTERRRVLIEDFGMSEEIVSRLPEDRPTPPPPGSRTAASMEL